jgi:hypothetical protein
MTSMDPKPGTEENPFVIDVTASLQHVDEDLFEEADGNLLKWIRDNYESPLAFLREWVPEGELEVWVCGEKVEWR